MTAGGQKSRTTDLPPAAFRVNIPVVPMPVSGSYPYRVRAWRRFPMACLPTIGVAIPAVVTANPDVLPAWAYCPAFPDADRGPKSYYDLSLSWYYSKSKSKQCSKDEFSHSLLLRLNRQVHGRSGKADCFNFVYCARAHLVIFAFISLPSGLRRISSFLSTATLTGSPTINPRPGSPLRRRMRWPASNALPINFPSYVRTQHPTEMDGSSGSNPSPSIHGK
jgi:hypothetical protein